MKTAFNKTLAVLITIASFVIFGIAVSLYGLIIKILVKLFLFGFNLW